MRMLLLTICLVLWTSAGTPLGLLRGAQEPTIELPPALARVLTDYQIAWRSRDAAALARLFAEDGFVLPPGTLPIRGRGRIEKHYSGAGGQLLLRAIAYETDGAVGFIIGGYRYEDGPDVGKFTITVRRNSAGRWLIVSDMDNSNRRNP